MVPAEPSPRHEVVAGALVRGGRILLAHRSPARRWYPDVWDLPGHVEPGEPARTALVRELAEELGVVVQHCSPAGSVEAADLRLTLFRVDGWAGDPANRAPDEHDELRWCTSEDLVGLRMAHEQYAVLLVRLLSA